MLISELEAALAAFRAEHGDVEVVTMNREADPAGEPEPEVRYREGEYHFWHDWQDVSLRGAKVCLVW